jgi:hypothetical protein
MKPRSDAISGSEASFVMANDTRPVELPTIQDVYE